MPLFAVKVEFDQFLDSSRSDIQHTNTTHFISYIVASSGVADRVF